MKQSIPSLASAHAMNGLLDPLKVLSATSLSSLSTLFIHKLITITFSLLALLRQKFGHFVSCASVTRENSQLCDYKMVTL